MLIFGWGEVPLKMIILTRITPSYEQSLVKLGTEESSIEPLFHSSTCGWRKIFSNWKVHRRGVLTFRLEKSLQNKPQNP